MRKSADQLMMKFYDKILAKYEENQEENIRGKRGENLKMKILFLYTRFTPHNL